MLVSVFEGRGDITALRYSVADSDIVATWYFITGFGLLDCAGWSGHGRVESSPQIDGEGPQRPNSDLYKLRSSHV